MIGFFSTKSSMLLELRKRCFLITKLFEGDNVTGTKSNKQIDEPVGKLFFGPISSLFKKNNPR